MCNQHLPDNLRVLPVPSVHGAYRKPLGRRSPSGSQLSSGEWWAGPPGDRWWL